MNDKILILEDTDGDGKADKCTVFADDLHCPTGFEFCNGGVLVAQAPGPDVPQGHRRRRQGRRPRARARRPRLGRHAPHVQQLRRSIRAARSTSRKARSTTRRSRRPYGPPVRCANAGVFRYEPRTQKFDVYVSFGFANPHGHVFDRWGQDIVIDGTGAQPVPRARCSPATSTSRRSTPARRRSTSSGPGPAPASRSSPAGTSPTTMQGNLLVANVIGFQGILQYKIERQRLQLRRHARLEPIVSSTDPNFRPVDLEDRPRRRHLLHRLAQPDHRPHAAQPPRPEPRPRRTAASTASPTKAGRCSKPAKIAGEPIAKLLDLLKEPEDRVRYRAKIELGGRDTERGHRRGRRSGSPASTRSDAELRAPHARSALAAPVPQRRRTSTC